MEYSICVAAVLWAIFCLGLLHLKNCTYMFHLINSASMGRDQWLTIVNAVMTLLAPYRIMFFFDWLRKYYCYLQNKISAACPSLICFSFSYAQKYSLGIQNRRYSLQKILTRILLCQLYQCLFPLLTSGRRILEIPYSCDNVLDKYFCILFKLKEHCYRI